ncbi:MAG TPA: acyltransferase [Bacteroidales bacterium]|nr:acyltransferase [Bacteroidales bacterium]
MLLPVYVSRRTKLYVLKGKVEIETPLRTGMITIGYGNVGIFDKKIHRAIWEVTGTIAFKGEAMLKFGSKITVGEKGVLTIGNKFRISTNSTIICFRKISFGNNCRISWDVIIMDTDFHYITTRDGKILNSPKEIRLGNNTWVGMRCVFSKGAILDDNIIVASNSLINKEIKGSFQIIGGTPAKILKEQVTWWDENEYHQKYGN